MALIVAGAAYLFWTIFLVYKYLNFGFYDWDLALSAQTLWSLGHGSMTPSLMGMNFLANHAEYIAFVLAPLYKILPSPLTLLQLKVLTFVGSSLILYRLSREAIGVPAALLIMLFYLLHPSTIFSLIYEFHFESLAIILLLLMFYFFRQKRLWPFYLTMVLASTVKENIPPVIAAFGIFALLSRDRDRRLWAAVPLIYGLFVTFVSLFVVIPLARRGLDSANQYLFLYQHMGNTPKEIFAQALNPIRIYEILSQKKNLEFVVDVFAPLGYAPFLSPIHLLISLPILLQVFLSSKSSHFHNIYYHFASTAVPFVFLAFIYTLRSIQMKIRPWLFGLLLLVLSFNFAVSLRRHAGHIKGLCLELIRPENKLRREMIRKIPPDAGVLTSLEYDDPLVNRRGLYSILNVARGMNGLSGKPWRFPSDLTYAMIDLEDDFLDGEMRKNHQRIVDFFDQHDWTILEAMDTHVLLTLLPNPKGPRFRDIVRHSAQPLLKEQSQNDIRIGAKLQLLKIEMPEDMACWKERIPLRIHWKALADIQTDIDMVFNVLANNQEVYSMKRRIGYTLHPTSTWRHGEYITEEYWLPIPNLKAADYTINLVFRNLEKDDVIPIEILHREEAPLRGNVLTNVLQFTVE